MPTPQDIDRLFAELGSLAPYPPGAAPVPAMIPGTSFFPGGRGGWGRAAAAPARPQAGCVMIVGHNWGTETDHAAALRRGHERQSDPTFKGLAAVIDAAGIARSECFPTNVYMELLTGHSNVGQFPADVAFRRRCMEFFRRQLDVLQPRTILVLGGDALEAVAGLSTDLECWLHAGGERRMFPEIDGVGLALRVTHFTGHRDAIGVAALSHPCNANRQHSPKQRWPRRYAGLSHRAAEVRLVQDACQLRASPR